MSSASRYRNFLRVMEQWPLDKAKTGRDLGAHIREEIAKGFQHGEATVVDPEKCDRILESLRRLSTDHYRKTFPRRRTSTATGMTLDSCRMMTSNEAIEYFKEYNEGLWTRLKMTVKNRGRRRQES